MIGAVAEPTRIVLEFAHTIMQAYLVARELRKLNNDQCRLFT